MDRPLKRAPAIEVEESQRKSLLQKAQLHSG